jgi:dihydroflavonol-4-reductase
MKCLVTGGTGFIGSHVVRSLTRRNHTVKVFYPPGDGNPEIESLSGVEMIEGDTRDYSEVLEAMDDCELVFHLAAIYRIWTPNPERIFEVNVEGTRNVLDACIETGVERLVHTSSLVAYHEDDIHTPVSETSPIRETGSSDAYSDSKIESHLLVRDYIDDGLNAVIVAPTLPIGPGDRRPTPTGRILLSNVQNPVTMALESPANCGDVRDIAEGHVLAAEKAESGEEFLLGGRNMTMVELAEVVQSITGMNKPIIKPPLWVVKSLAWVMEKYSDWISGEPPQFTPAAIEIAHQGFSADCSKAKEELNLPVRPIEESVESALRWFQEHGHIGALKKLSP